MTIAQIKASLLLATVLEHYHLKPDKNKMLRCPFHDDKNASMQVSYSRNHYKCHACNKKGDVIQFVQDYEKITKHQALLKCTAMITIYPESEANNPKTTAEPTTNQQEKIIFLEKMFLSFRKGLLSSIPAKAYCKSRNLNFETLEIGFNAGQFHHGERKDQKLIHNSLQYGLLSLAGTNSRTGGQAYKPFANRSIIFPLRNKQNQIVSLYFRSIVPPSGAEGARHFYLKNRQGLYPNYPHINTKKIILTESIIDCASLIQSLQIQQNQEDSTNSPFGGWGALACYGTNGLTEEHIKAITALKQLEEIIFAFDNDTAGRTATTNYSQVLLELLPTIKISVLEPINKDINETLQLHNEEIFIELLDKRKPLSNSQKPTENLSFSEENKKEELSTKLETPPSGVGGLNFLKRKHLLKNLNIEIGKAGIVGEENSRMLLFLIIISYLNKSPLHALVQGSSGSGKTHIINRIADLMPPEDVLRFTRITESSLYNWGEFDLFQKVIIIEDLDGLKEDALYALREFISNQVLRSSVTIKDKKGNNKSSHKIVKGQFSSLSATTKGETYEDNMSRSFLIAVDESKEQTAKIIDYQNKRNAGEIDPNESQKAIGFIQSIVRNLKVYEVINPYATQLHLPEKVHKIRRLNEMYQAVIKQVTFLNQYQRQIVKSPSFGGVGEALITEIEDIEQATEVLFESIILKVDELDGSLRQFFERLKKHVKTENQEFLQREIRQLFNISKTQLQRFINTLLELEYIKQSGGYNNKGIKYKIAYWDNHQKLRAEIKDFLMNQIQNLSSTKL
ncbi:CHC2 zinc finger domain-containing protein [Flavobacterium davisii]|uniref:CHC2 zinc finger domain-containing protein n=2 Tax=Flavobacterium TaxID=237 RepID=A0ABW8PSM3_9FLAO